LLESYLARHGLPEVGEDIIPDPEHEHDEVSNGSGSRRTSSIVVQTDSITVSPSNAQELVPGEAEASVGVSPRSGPGSEPSPTCESFAAIPVTRHRDDDHDSGYSDTGSSIGMVDILRELSIQASGGYLGASSSITLGRMVTAITSPHLHSRHSSISSSFGSSLDTLLRLADSAPEDDISDWELKASLLTPEATDRLVHGYLKYVAYRLPVFFTPSIRQNHLQRTRVKYNAYHRATLYMVYALGAQSLETVGENGDTDPDRYYDAAVGLLEEVLRMNDIRGVILLLLLGLYCLGRPKGPGAW
jgi:hypothetical protein